MWGLFLRLPNQRNRKDVSFTNQRNFFFKNFFHLWESTRWFREPKKELSRPQNDGFIFVIFNDFDGFAAFAKHHPSTLKFRETIMASTDSTDAVSHGTHGSGRVSVGTEERLRPSDHHRLDAG